MVKKEYSVEIGGKKLVAQFNDLADQADGSVIVRYGDTVVLVTAVMGEERGGIDYFPLTVEYEEKFYASGRILGSRYQRREGRPSDEAILSGRIVDRTIRPLFNHQLRNEVQVVVTILSLDQDDPDTLGVIGASLALGTSDIPWEGPVGAIRIGKIKGQDDFIINPAYGIRENPDYEFDLVACGKDGLITMIEVGSNEIDNKTFISALEIASAEIEKIQVFQKNVIREIGKKKKEFSQKEVAPAHKELFEKEFASRLESAVFSNTAGKESMETLALEWGKTLKEKFPEDSHDLAIAYFDEIINDLVHAGALKGKRVDGRKMDQVRELYAQAGGISPILHGTGVFYRGETHVLSVLTLAGPQDAQLIEGMELQETKRFMHHYNFPPFSTGETGKLGGTNRRMIGHGALAEKALVAVIPEKEIFPYTIRIVSESMASNGSTSMASVCASTLALMDAGVPIKAPVAGIAMGLMMKNEKEYAILTDIQGPEDHHGDMDFKVAGTKNGITAIQLDIKVGGIPISILEEALEQATTARHHILQKIESEISAPRPEISPRAPHIISIKIKQDQIGLVIGPGGKTIKGIKEKTGAQVDIEDDGTVFITGKNGAAGMAKNLIEVMTHEFAVGEKYVGEVVKILDFGAFVRISDTTEGLVHVSEIAPFRIERVESVLKIGDKVPVVIKGIDEKKRLSLSIKLADKDFIKKPVV